MSYLCVLTVVACSEWQAQRQVFKDARARYRSTLRGRAGPFPPHLVDPFPKFGTWLNNHVRMLRDEGFPISTELESLHCLPSEFVTSYQAMWAYGAHYVCTSECGPGYVSFDSGIAAIPPDSEDRTIDVGILRDIIRVSYGDVNCALMQGSWIKSRDQGRSVIRKDRYGFWTVLYNVRDSENSNPFVYPASVSQVFFMEDSLLPDWRVVLKHDVRSRRVVGDTDVVEFGASGSGDARGNASTDVTETQEADSTEYMRPVEVPIEQYVNVAAEEEDPLDERHLDDTQFEDEVELQYVE